MPNSTNATSSNIDSKLKILADSIATNQQKVSTIIEDLSLEIIKRLKKKRQIFSNDSQLDTWVQAQAGLFWWYNKKGKIQEIYGELEDYFNGKAYLAFIFFENFIKCRRNEDKECSFKRASFTELQLLQYITVEQYRQYKSYLNWVSRTNKKSQSTESEYAHDFFDASNIIHKGMVNCIQCKYFQGCSLLNNISSKIIHCHPHIILTTLKRIKIDDIQYHRYFTAFIKLFDNIINNKISSWSILQTAMLGIINLPNTVSIFEFLIIRTALTVHLNQIPLTGSTDYSQMIEKYAWAVWFSKGHPFNQTYKGMLDDYYQAKRYIACLVADEVINESNSNVRKISIIKNKNAIELLKSVFLEEYAYYKYCEKSLEIFRIYQFGDIKKEVLFNHIDDFLSKIKNSESTIKTTVQKEIISRMSKQTVVSVKNAKIYSLSRLLGNVPEDNLKLLDTHMDYFYDNQKVANLNRAIDLNYCKKVHRVINVYESLAICG